MRSLIYAALSLMIFVAAIMGCSKSKHATALKSGTYVGTSHYTENDVGADSLGHTVVTNVDTSFVDTVKIENRPGDSTLIVYYRHYNPGLNYYAATDTFKYSSSNVYYQHNFDNDYDMFRLPTTDSLYGLCHTYGGGISGYYNSHDNAFSGKKL